MDIWVLARITLSVLAGALLGLLTGWLLWARSRRRWQRRAVDTEASLWSTTSKLKESSRRIAQLDENLADSESQLRELNAMLAVRATSIVDLEDELALAISRTNGAELALAVLRDELDELRGSGTSVNIELTGTPREPAAVSSQREGRLDPRSRARNAKRPSHRAGGEPADPAGSTPSATSPGSPTAR